jgi:hypothetical protein
MGCQCQQFLGFAECLWRLSDPDLYAVPWLLELCRDNCGCIDKPSYSESDRSDITQPRYRGHVSHRYSSTPWDYSDNEDSSISGEDLVSRLGSLTFSSRQCYGECSAEYLGCGDLAEGCRCVGRPKNHGYHVIGCRIPWLSSHNGKRELALDPDEGCLCNSTYISHACCEASDGLVFEPPHLKLGELETSSSLSSTLSLSLSSSSILPVSSSILLPPSPSTIPDQRLDLQRRNGDTVTDRGLINCFHKPVLDRTLSGYVFRIDSPAERYRNLWELCHFSDERDDTMGCTCEKGYSSPTCRRGNGNPLLFASRILRRRCELECDCPPEDPDIAEYISSEESDDEEDDDQHDTQNPTNSDPTSEPTNQGRTGQQKECKSGCTGNTFNCFSGGSLGVKEESCRCALEFVGPGLDWGNRRCIISLSRLTSLGLGLSLGQSLGGRDTDSVVLREDLVCPCNWTYVSKACCEADEGLVWESSDLRLGRLV